MEDSAQLVYQLLLKAIETKAKETKKKRIPEQNCCDRSAGSFKNVKKYRQVWTWTWGFYQLHVPSALSSGKSASFLNYTLLTGPHSPGRATDESTWHLESIVVYEPSLANYDAAVV